MNKYPLVIMFIMLGLSWGLSRVFPLTSGLGKAGETAGFIFILCGVTLIIAAGGLFRSKGTTTDPTKKPDKLVTNGIYHYTRNPMYLGMLLILSGFPFVVESLIGLIFPIIFFLYMDRKIIPEEEKTVEGTFGEIYREYKFNTRRWI